MKMRPVLPDPRTNRSLNCKLTEEQYETLRQFAVDERQPMTQIVRLALDEFMTRIRRERAA